MKKKAKPGTNTMLAENLTYLIAFITTSGITVFSILVSYQLIVENKRSEFQLLLYQQIFLFSFFIYSIWGNLAIRQVIADININSLLIPKLALVIPLLGMPFLMISWFMLLKFSFNMNGFRPGKIWIYIYFPGFLVLISFAVLLFHLGYLKTPANPDRFLLRIFACLNLVFHLLFLLPFLKPKPGSKVDYSVNEIHKCLLVYLSATFIESLLLWVALSFGFLVTAVSILLLFASSAFLPACIRFFVSFKTEVKVKAPGSFHSFCEEYHISKREAEIILEICAGKTNKAIADKLFITLQTVKDHTHRIYTKTQVKSRVQLANLVMEKSGKTKTGVKS